MTITEIRTRIKRRLNLTSTTADTRIDETINEIYRQIATKIGLELTRRTTGLTATATPGSPLLTFTNVENIERVYDDNSGTEQFLGEESYDVLRTETAQNSDTPTKFARQSWTSSTYTIRCDVVFLTAVTIKADGIAIVADLSGTNEPAFPESFHDILVHGVLHDEYMKMEKPALAAIEERAYNSRLADIQLWRAKSIRRDVRQGGNKTATSAFGGGGSGAFSGAPSWTQTGLITFDRDTDAPFAVTDTSDYVPNLFAEGVGNVTTDRLIGRDTTGTGESEQLTVGGGIEFTGSGGIQTSAFTGDVTKSAGGTALSIAAGVVTEAMQVLADNTTNDVSTTKHGYAPKAPNDATYYLDGTGAYSVPAGVTDHGALTGLSDDDHTIYALLAGRSGGQTIVGGTGATDGLTVNSTSNGTKGVITLGSDGSHVVVGGSTAASELRFMEPSGSGSNYTALKAQAQAGDVTYTLPAADGGSGDVLQTNGSGTLSWVTPGASQMQELIFSAMANVPPTSAYATLDTRNNHPVLDFDGTTDEEAVFHGVLPSTYNGGGLTVKIWVSFTSATSGSAHFQAAFERINASGLDIDADSFAAFNESSAISAPGTSGQVVTATVTFTDGADMDSLAAGEMFRLKIRRDADGTGGTDDITTDAELHRVVISET